MRVNIDGLDRAAVLAALFNASRQQGRGFLNEEGRAQLTADRAREILVNVGDRFDYLMGRVLKVDLPVGAEEVDCRLYDEANGPEAGLMVVASLRSTNDPNNSVIQYMHADGTYQASLVLQRSIERQAELRDEAGVATLHFADKAPRPRGTPPLRNGEEELRE
jgi:hypothetical protein